MYRRCRQTAPKRSRIKTMASRRRAFRSFKTSWSNGGLHRAWTPRSTSQCGFHSLNSSVQFIQKHHCKRRHLKRFPIYIAISAGSSRLVGQPAEKRNFIAKVSLILNWCEFDNSTHRIDHKRRLIALLADLLALYEAHNRDP